MRLRGLATRLAFVTTVVFAVVFCIGCHFESMDEHPCPTGGTTLTYENFGKPFFDANCNTCHSADSGARNGAPENFAFDTVEHSVQAILSRARMSFPSEQAHLASYALMASDSRLRERALELIASGQSAAEALSTVAREVTRAATSIVAESRPRLTGSVSGNI